MRRITVFLLSMTLMLVCKITYAQPSPTFTSDYTITSSVEYLDVTLGDYVTLTIDNNAVLTISGALAVGDGALIVINEGSQLVNTNIDHPNDGYLVVIKKTIAPNKWYTLSTSGHDPMGLWIYPEDIADGWCDLYYYDEPTHYWMSRVNEYSSVFDEGETGWGYLFRVNDDEYELEMDNTLCATDLPNSDWLTPYLTTSSYDGQLRGFNLVGNPYTHNIYKGGGSPSPSISDGALASGYYRIDENHQDWYPCSYSEPIKPCEGILIKTTVPHHMAFFDNTIIATEEKPLSWNSKSRGYNSELELTVKGNSGNDRAFAYFFEGNGLDKIEHLSETTPSLYIRYDDTDYAIAHVDEDCQSLDVMFKNTQTGYYTLSLDDTKAHFSYLHLIDNETGDDVDMLKEKSYRFYAFGNEPENRFKLIVSQGDEVVADDDNVFAYISNGDIVITGLTSTATLQMFDVAGRLVGNDVVKGNGGSVCRVTKPQASGVYVLRLITADGSKTQKIVIE